MARMASAAQRRLTLIHAGTGFGKTTLIDQWSRSSGCPVVRLHIAERDNDPVHILKSMGGALGLEFASGAPRSWGALLPQVLEALSRVGELILAFDGYDAIEDDESHRVVAALVSGASPCVRFVIASRTEPPLPLGRLRTRREVAVIKERELCFTPQEAWAFFESVGVRGLSPAEVESLTAVTSGWVAGLQMAAFGLGACADPRAFVEALASRSVLLVAEALAHQSPDLQEFLLLSSILPRKTGAACDALTGRDDGEARLRELCDRGVICGRAPEDRSLYCTHPVLDEHLRVTLERDHPDRIASLHARSAEHFSAVGRWEEAWFHALRSGDPERAAGVIEAFGPKALARGEVVLLRRQLEALPGDIAARRPGLAALAAEVTAWSAAAASREKAIPLVPKAITDRQRDVLDLMLAGYSCREIALKLRLSQETVRIHYRRMSELVAVMGRA